MMTKKSRKPNLPQDTLNRARRELYGAAAVEEPTPASQPVEAPRPKPVAQRRAILTTEGDLRREYAYVVSDLRNMAVLAAMLLAILVVMSVFI
jgi:hypothetical protein